MDTHHSLTNKRCVRQRPLTVLFVLTHPKKEGGQLALKFLNDKDFQSSDSQRKNLCSRG
jgi:hypothetical protein